MNFDDCFYLMGDEDGDVGVHCRICDTGGAPVVFYSTDTRVTGYENVDVVIVHAIVHLLVAMKDHVAKHV